MGGSQSIQFAVINLVDDQRLIDTVITDSSGEWNLALIFNSYNYRFIATDSTTRLFFRDVSAGTISTDAVVGDVANLYKKLHFSHTKTIQARSAGFFSPHYGLWYRAKKHPSRRHRSGQVCSFPILSWSLFPNISTGTIFLEALEVSYSKTKVSC